MQPSRVGWQAAQRPPKHAPAKAIPVGQLSSANPSSRPLKVMTFEGGDISALVTPVRIKLPAPENEPFKKLPIQWLIDGGSGAAPLMFTR